MQDFFFFDTTAKQVREHMSAAIRSSATRGYVGKDITQARGQNSVLRWLDWTFLKGYLPSLSINYVAMSKDMEKRLPQRVLHKDGNFL